MESSTGVEEPAAVEWAPGNSLASERHKNWKHVDSFAPPPEYIEAMKAAGTPITATGPYIPEDLPFVKPGSRIDHGIIFGPEMPSKGSPGFDAQFNPTAFKAIDPEDGKEKVFMVIRGEINLPATSKWKRKSLPYLAVSEDGIHFKRVSNDPWFDVTLRSFEDPGGIEDCRYADLRLKPYVDPKTGKSYDGAIMYTGFDGKTARVGLAVFNHSDPYKIHKIGLVFKEKKSRKEWIKSDVHLQYYTFGPNGGKKIVNLMIVGEGNIKHDGIHAITSKKPLEVQWPDKNKPFSIVAKPGTVTEGLVEPAFRPYLTELPAWLQKKTGLKNGVVVVFHGDAPPLGYVMKYAILDPQHPERKPVYEATAPFNWQTTVPTFEQVQKVHFGSGSEVVGNRFFIYYGIGDSYIGAVSYELNGLLLDPSVAH